MEGLGQATSRIQFNNIDTLLFLTFCFFDIKGDRAAWILHTLCRTGKARMNMPQGHIIESLEKVTGHIGEPTHRITGFRQHQFSKTLTIAIILLRNCKMRHQDMSFVRIKSFFHILKNVGQGITNPLNFLFLIILIVNTSINRIDKRQQENLAILQLNRLKSLLQTCT